MKKDFIFEEIIQLKGVGPQLSKYLKKKRIEKVKDIILNLPYSETDRSKIYKLNELEIGRIQSIKVLVKKLNFPRLRNLPNKISCEDETGKIEIVYFNSREGYLRKLFPVNEWVIISGKINYFNKKYQITNPEYVVLLENQDYVIKNIPKYNLTKGINEKKYRKISEQVLNNLPTVQDWLNEDFVKKNNLIEWNQSIQNLHKSKDAKNGQSKSFRRIVFDELCANFLTLSENRQRVKKNKLPKNFNNKNADLVIQNLPFELTLSQKKVIEEINLDLLSNKRMFRIIQGDVGSGKTIVSLLSIINVIKSGYQCALMSPTEILSKQHYELSKKIFKNINIEISFLTGKTDYKKRKEILNNILKKIPILRTIYSAIGQMTESFTKSDNNQKSVVLLEYPRKGVWAVGFATKENEGLIKNKLKEDIVNVFVPTTPNPTSGFLLMIPKNDLIYLDVTFEQASKFIVSAGTTNIN
tara:strand:- start:1022 stop:2428 length:1407 start_codon:yes stop_codon:yes gene_type:complete